MLHFFSCYLLAFWLCWTKVWWQYLGEGLKSDWLRVLVCINQSSVAVDGPVIALQLMMYPLLCQEEIFLAK